MLRKFVERKVRRQIIYRSLLISSLAFAAIMALLYTQGTDGLLRPVNMFVDNFEGALYNIAMVLTGGNVSGFTLSPDGGYMITFSGGNPVLWLQAGYLGCALLGSIMFFLVNRAPHLVRGLTALTGAFTVGYLALFIRPDATGDWLSWVVCAGFGALLIALGWKGRGDINQFRSWRSLTQIVMTVVALMTALHVVLDLPYILSTRAHLTDEKNIIINPVAALVEEHLGGGSVSPIAGLWSAIAIALLAAAFYFSISRQLRQIPKNDDIV